MNKDKQYIDKIFFPAAYASKISTRISTLILAILTLGMLNTLPEFLKLNFFEDFSSIMQVAGKFLIVILVIVLNGAIDAFIFSIPTLGLSSTLMNEKDNTTKGSSYLIILIKIYLLAHIPLKFVEYTLSFLDYNKNFGIGFLSNYYFTLTIHILLVAWFSLSISRCLQKVLSIPKNYEISLVLGIFGWFNLISMAVNLVMDYAFRLVLQYHF